MIPSGWQNASRQTKAPVNRTIITFDVWEHAYYLDYQNRRAEHLSKMWGIVDWKVLGERYDNQ